LFPILRALVRLFSSAISVIYLPVALALLICRVRLITLTHPDRIGHLCAEPDCFIKEGVLGLRAKFFGILLIPEDRVANKVILDLWKTRVTTITSPAVCMALKPLLIYSFVKYPIDHYVVAMNGTASCGAILAKWGARPPLLRSDAIDHQPGWDALHALGMPPGSWFACVHSRDGHYSPADEHLHSYRNSSIESYQLAMEAIVERGGWCIRVGEPTPAPMPKMLGVIDYANSSAKSDWMDVFLCANCSFFLGNSSGLFWMATIFARHCALANLIPVSGALPCGFNDLGIPKVLSNLESHRQLSFREVMKSPIANFRFTWQYEKAGIQITENSPQDIRAMTVEMLDRLAQRSVYDELDEYLQQKFHRLMLPGHYSYGASSRIGRDFLRKHAHLI
jgi:putative glycosyltransferase (TIGR04372 family)